MESLIRCSSPKWGCGLWKHEHEYNPSQLGKHNYRCIACGKKRDLIRRGLLPNPEGLGAPASVVITAGEYDITKKETVEAWRGPWTRAVQVKGQGRSAFSDALNFDPGLLDSAHIRGSKQCDTLDCKRDVNNGFLLTKSEHKMFETGYLGLDLDGNWLYSNELTAEEWLAHGFDIRIPRRVPAELWGPERFPYAFWHFNNVFRKGHGYTTGGAA